MSGREACDRIRSRDCGAFAHLHSPSELANLALACGSSGNCHWRGAGPGEQVLFWFLRGTAVITAVSPLLRPLFLGALRADSCASCG